MQTFMRNLSLWLGITESRYRPNVEGKREGLITLSGYATRSKIPQPGTATKNLLYNRPPPDVRLDWVQQFSEFPVWQPD